MDDEGWIGNPGHLKCCHHECNVLSELCFTFMPKFAQFMFIPNKHSARQQIGVHQCCKVNHFGIGMNLEYLQLEPTDRLALCKSQLKKVCEAHNSYPLKRHAVCNRVHYLIPCHPPKNLSPIRYTSICKIIEYSGEWSKFFGRGQAVTNFA